MPDNNRDVVNGIKGIFGGGNRKAPEDPVHKLTRMELLELLIEQTREAEDLKKRNKELTEELARCKADLDRTASLEVVIHRLEDIVAGRFASQNGNAAASAAKQEEIDPELAAWNAGLPLDTFTGGETTEGDN